MGGDVAGFAVSPAIRDNGVEGAGTVDVAQSDAYAACFSGFAVCFNSRVNFRGIPGVSDTGGDPSSGPVCFGTTW